MTDKEELTGTKIINLIHLNLHDYSRPINSLIFNHSEIVALIPSYLYDILRCLNPINRCSDNKEHILIAEYKVYPLSPYKDKMVIFHKFYYLEPKLIKLPVSYEYV